MCLLFIRALPGGSAGKESACNEEDLGLIPGLGRSPGEGKGYSLQYSGLENSMDYMVHGVTKSWTQLCNFHFHFLLASLVAQRLKHLPPMWDTWVRSLGQEDPLAKEMAIHSSILAWRSHGQRSLVGYSPRGRKESDTTE